MGHIKFPAPFLYPLYYGNHPHYLSLSVFVATILGTIIKCIIVTHTINIIEKAINTIFASVFWLYSAIEI